MPQPVLNQYEKDLFAIINFNPETQYITSAGQIKDRCALSQYCIGDYKVGTLLGRLCKLLNLDYFTCVKNFFDAELPEASQYVKKTFVLVLAQPSELDLHAKKDLIIKTANRFNDFVLYVNEKRKQHNRDQIPRDVHLNVNEFIKEASKRIGASSQSQTQESGRKKNRKRRFDEIEETSAPPNTPRTPDTTQRRQSLRIAKRIKL
jgi:hypothetical protein